MKIGELNHVNNLILVILFILLITIVVSLDKCGHQICVLQLQVYLLKTLMLHVKWLMKKIIVYKIIIIYLMVIIYVQKVNIMMEIIAKQLQYKIVFNKKMVFV